MKWKRLVTLDLESDNIRTKCQIKQEGNSNRDCVPGDATVPMTESFFWGAGGGSVLKF